TQKKIREHISALSDGELATSDLELAFAALRAPDGEQAWNTYHRIGDVLRAQAAPELSDDFTERLAARLASEPSPARRTAGAAGAQPEADAAAPAPLAASGAKKVATTS
ncbi:MAG TPA: sigma-E factor negative regulatory protein, partial [Telluria sp.]|nr:sigma-E factor negative regulatory protein [Telluria sp.]